MTQIKAKARLSADNAQANVKKLLQRFAYTLDPKHAIEKRDSLTLGGGVNNKSCHGEVAKAIKQRGNPEDLIWIYGNGPGVAHSVLTNEDHQVLVDTYKKTGKFLGAQGYEFGDDKFDLLDVVPVSEIYDDYMNYEVTSATDDAEKEASKSKKENLDRQIENNKQQQEQIKKTMPSKENKTAVSPAQKIDKQKQINRLKDQALDMRKQKLES